MNADPVELLRARRLRVTPQRRAILGVFRGRIDEHLAADEVHSRATAVVPEIGRGTVYATLAELAELGLLASVGSSEPIRYETNVRPHDHFHCRLCLRLFDVELGATTEQLEGYVVERINVVAEGICAECSAYKRGLQDGAGEMLHTQQIDEALLAMLACTAQDTPLGTLLLSASPRGVVRLAFEDHADAAALAKRARTRRGPRAARRRAERVGETLASYFSGGREPWHDEVDWVRAEEASAGALEATRGIPFGSPRSYSQLGVEIEAYRCGFAMGSNPVPILLPCHRVSCGSEYQDVWVGGRDRLMVIRKLEADALAAEAAG
jgi:Fe2+ or Zn2+ uptake regulation protein/O6-methylguanine-DNA--protein-cysteine methyltransferase